MLITARRQFSECPKNSINDEPQNMDNEFIEKFKIGYENLKKLLW